MRNISGIEDALSQRDLNMFEKNKGFSLIELLVIVAILAVVVAMAIPQVQTSMAGDRLLTSRDNLAAELNLARTLAISRNATYEIEFDSSAGTYQIIDVVDPENPPRAAKQLENGVALGNVPASPIRFFARGYSTGGNIVLVSSAGSACALTINRSGNVEIGSIRSNEETY